MSIKHCTRCGYACPDEALYCSQCGTALHRADQDPLIGQTIAGRYYLIERIGQGGAGTLYRAEHVTLRRRMAVKLLHHQLSVNEEAVERFRREAITVCEIDNDHILQVHDFGRADDGRLFFAMEYLEGEPLSALLLREGTLSVERCCDIMGQLADALMEAHALGYVHRDLRPRNVFLTRRRGRTDFVKLLDFGLAKLVLPDVDAAKTNMGMTFGDPHYMAPEQARGEVVDRRADLYSLGAIAHEMLLGEAPYKGSGTFDILSKVLDAPVPRVRDRRADCPEWLEAVVRVSLAKSPVDRFATVAQLLTALERKQVPERQPPFAVQVVPPSREKMTAIDMMTPIRANSISPPAKETAPEPQLPPVQGQGQTGHSPSPSGPPARGGTRAYEAIKLDAPPVTVEVGRESTPSGTPKLTRREKRLLEQERRAQDRVPPGRNTGEQMDRKAREIAAREVAERAAMEAAEVEARQKAERAARQRAEQEARHKVQQEAHLKAEQEARLRAEEEARLKAEQEARLKTEQEARLRAEEEARRRAEQEAQTKAEREIERKSRKTADRAKAVASRIMQQSAAEKKQQEAAAPVPKQDVMANEAAVWEEAAQQLLNDSAADDRTLQTPKAPPSVLAQDLRTEVGEVALPIEEDTGAATARLPAMADGDVTQMDLPRLPEADARQQTAPETAKHLTGEHEQTWFNTDLAAGKSTAQTPIYQADEYEPQRGRPMNVVVGLVVAVVMCLGIATLYFVSRLRAPSGQATTPAPGEGAPPAVVAPEPVKEVPKEIVKEAPPPVEAEKPVSVAKEPTPPPKAPPPVVPQPVEQVRPVVPPPVKEPVPPPRKAPQVKLVAEKAPPLRAGKAAPVLKKPEPAIAHPPEPVEKKVIGESAEALIGVGRQRLQGGDVSAAAASFTKARELNPRSAEAVAGLGEVAFEQGNWDEAVKQLRQAVKLAPRHAAYQVLLGQSLYKLGRFKDAADTCRRVLKQDPGLREAQQTLELAEKKLGEAGESP